MNRLQMNSGISRNTVKEHMVLAMKQIREHFEQLGDTPAGFIVFADVLPQISPLFLSARL